MITHGETTIRINHTDGATTMGDLHLVESAIGIVVFAHGSGSSRLSPRNRMVAAELQRRGLSTLLLDLLTPEEEQYDVRGGRLRFDVELLARRLASAVAALRAQPPLNDLPVGYFGASTGAAAALIAAAEHPEGIGAIVSRGGRPDLAGEHLSRVQAPTLLIVGGDDTVVIELNQQALRQLRAPAQLVIVPGATHLFEEPGTLEKVAELAGEWFVTHLGSAAANR